MSSQHPAIESEETEQEQSWLSEVGRPREPLAAFHCCVQGAFAVGIDESRFSLLKEEEINHKDSTDIKDLVRKRKLPGNVMKSMWVKLNCTFSFITNDYSDSK
ncbi:hypothetical protein P7K49_009927 [Saguinus oedipus]|uniref:Uncharacterized protein n=1 Tax=Saguinus oedipus TaxID=9490 RepID=A0ABQ9VM11_SAGOE|nr:hypothetical protein P7K49_009927 [Saguinus oedipus]